MSRPKKRTVLAAFAAATAVLAAIGNKTIDDMACLPPRRSRRTTRLQAVPIAPTRLRSLPDRDPITGGSLAG